MTDETNQESTPSPSDEATSDANVPTRWTKGMASPNPRGRPPMVRTVREVKALAREHTHMAIQTLAKIAANPKSPPAARQAAASSLLDRAWGKPSGDFEGAEQLVIHVVKFGDQQLDDDMKLIEGEVERNDDDESA
jgi:hypothetical protein